MGGKKQSCCCQYHSQGPLSSSVLEHVSPRLGEVVRNCFISVSCLLRTRLEIISLGESVVTPNTGSLL